MKLADLERDFVTAQEAAEILGISRPNLYARIERGYIPAIRLTERTLRIRRSDLENLLVNGYIKETRA